MAADESLPQRVFGWWDMFVNEADDPRADGGWENDERSVLLGFLSDRRLTLELKCSGLDADQMAHQSVPPSDMSLLGLVRHLTSVENYWVQNVIAGHATERLYSDPSGADLAFVVEPDASMVEDQTAPERHLGARAGARDRASIRSGRCGRGA